MLDTVDASLVRELQHDGRATYQSLAERAGVSRAVATARVRQLLGSGTVRVVGIVHPAVARIGAIAHVSLLLDGPAGPVAAAAGRRRAAAFVSTTAGRPGVVVDVRARDEPALGEELEVLRSLRSVRAIEVFRCVDVIKDAYAAAPRDASIPPLDCGDRRLLAALQRDGRASYAGLADEVGLSQPATRMRVIRLLETGAVHVAGLVDSAALGVREALGVGLGVTGSAREVAELGAQVPGVHYSMAGYGRFEVVCAVDAADRAGMLQGLERLRGLPGVVRTESWHHLSIVKESYVTDVEASTEEQNQSL